MILAALWTETGLVKALEILGSLGLFIYGMKIMSEGLQKIAGKRLRETLKGMTSNRFSGIITGFFTTCLVQSSSATTVMVVSFVNAGLLSLVESMGVIMGANIGTTFTLWMVTLFGFKFKISYISLIVIGIFFPFLFSKRQRLKHLSEFAVGFGILFIGLTFLKDSVPEVNKDELKSQRTIVSIIGDNDAGLIDVTTANGQVSLLNDSTVNYQPNEGYTGKDAVTLVGEYKYKQKGCDCKITKHDTITLALNVSSAVNRAEIEKWEATVPKSKLSSLTPDFRLGNKLVSWAKTLGKSGVISTLIFLLIGTIMTVVIQSSSAASAITVILLASGYVSFPQAAAMILGENIGTTITANLAALVGNVHAKRAARFHFFFNIAGVIWILLIMPLFLSMIKGSVDVVMGLVEGWTGDSAVNRENYMLALFHTTFNVANTLLLVWFVPKFAQLVIKLQPAQSEEDEEHHLQYISTGMMSTTEINISNARKVMEGFVRLVDKMGHNLDALIFEKKKRPERLIQKIYEREEMTDTFEVELAVYLTKMAESGISEDTAMRLTRMLSIANDLERIGDTYYAMTKNVERAMDNNYSLPEEAKKDLRIMFDIIHQSLKHSHQSFTKEGTTIDLEYIQENEKQINERRLKVMNKHYKRLETGIYSPEMGIVFMDFVNRLEKVHDQIVNICEAQEESLK